MDTNSGSPRNRLGCPRGDQTAANVLDVAQAQNQFAASEYVLNRKFPISNDQACQLK